MDIEPGTRVLVTDHEDLISYLDCPIRIYICPALNGYGHYCVGEKQEANFKNSRQQVTLSYWRFVHLIPKPEPKVMTKEDIERELGYEIHIVDEVYIVEGKGE